MFFSDITVTPWDSGMISWNKWALFPRHYNVGRNSTFLVNIFCPHIYVDALSDTLIYGWYSRSTWYLTRPHYNLWISLLQFTVFGGRLISAHQKAKNSAYDFTYIVHVIQCTDFSSSFQFSLNKPIHSTLNMKWNGKPPSISNKKW